MPRIQLPGSPLKNRVFTSMLLAGIGAAGGYLYARHILPPEHLEGSSLPGMYASMGAIVCILLVRLTVLFRNVLTDFLGRGRDHGGSNGGGDHDG